MHLRRGFYDYVETTSALRDGVCDELEAFGCTDNTACNYDPLATELDDSCIYEEEFYDCDGNCLSDTDSDGVCG